MCQEAQVEMVPWVLQAGTSLLSIDPGLGSGSGNQAPSEVVSSAATAVMVLLSVPITLAAKAEESRTGTDVVLCLDKALQIGRLFEASTRRATACPARALSLTFDALTSGIGQAITEASTLAGSGKERQQLAGVCFSFLKAARGPDANASDMQKNCCRVAAVAGSMLQHLLQKGPDAQGRWPVTEAIPWLVLIGRSLVLTTEPEAAVNLASTAAAYPPGTSGSVGADAYRPPQAAGLAQAATEDTVPPPHQWKTPVLQFVLAWQWLRTDGMAQQNYLPCRQCGVQVRRCCQQDMM
jgi:hypothetical protein